jgi:hypothetical protein
LEEKTPTVPRLPPRPPRTISTRRRIILLVLLGGIVLAEGVWALVTYWQKPAAKSEVLIYHVCLGSDPNLCPAGLTFVRNQGEDTLTRWAQQECSGYKARHIIVKEGPSPDCNCSLAEITCATEY